MDHKAAITEAAITKVIITEGNGIPELNPSPTFSLRNACFSNSLKRPAGILCRRGKHRELPAATPRAAPAPFAAHAWRAGSATQYPGPNAGQPRALRGAPGTAVTGNTRQGHLIPCRAPFGGPHGAGGDGHATSPPLRSSSPSEISLRATIDKLSVDCQPHHGKIHHPGAASSSWCLPDRGYFHHAPPTLDWSHTPIRGSAVPRSHLRPTPCHSPCYVPRARSPQEEGWQHCTFLQHLEHPRPPTPLPSLPLSPLVSPSYLHQNSGILKPTRLSRCGALGLARETKRQCRRQGEGGKTTGHLTRASNPAPADIEHCTTPTHSGGPQQILHPSPAEAPSSRDPDH